MKISEKIISKKIQGEIVLLNIENGDYFSLNPIGTEIFECISNGMHPSEIVTSLFEKYNVDLKNLENDVNSLIDKMIGKKILTNI